MKRRWPWLELSTGPWMWPTIHRNPMEDAVSFIVGPFRCKFVRSDIDELLKEMSRLFRKHDEFKPDDEKEKKD